MDIIKFDVASYRLKLVANGAEDIYWHLSIHHLENFKDSAFGFCQRCHGGFQRAECLRALHDAEHGNDNFASRHRAGFRDDFIHSLHSVPLTVGIQELIPSKWMGQAVDEGILGSFQLLRYLPSAVQKPSSCRHVPRPKHHAVCKPGRGAAFNTGDARQLKTLGVLCRLLLFGSQRRHRSQFTQSFACSTTGLCVGIRNFFRSCGSGICHQIGSVGAER
mmetsp:Transcript_5289/g.8498  ORF Transcript_5289/g.8498 Transcript_5289/m.8498 type:complete len:219 (+) Transcript_5289:974-1630(+)